MYRRLTFGALIACLALCAGTAPAMSAPIFSNVRAGVASTAQRVATPTETHDSPPPVVALTQSVHSFASAHQIPERCRQWQRRLTAEAHTVFGLDAPVAALAAQIEAESGCRPDVHSAYASGLTEFTPDTAADIARRYGAVLSPPDPMNPLWAIAAQVRYMHELTVDRAARSDCDRWAFGFSAYNGGDGWVSRDQKLCTARDPHGCDWQQWFGNVEKYSARSASAMLENRTYVKRILIDYAPAYTAAAWGASASCEPE